MGCFIFTLFFFFSLWSSVNIKNMGNDMSNAVWLNRFQICYASCSNPRKILSFRGIP